MAASTVLLFVNVRWWHPYCDTQADGPGVWGRGFPFPYEQASLASSMKFELLVPVYLLSLTIVALPIFAIIRTVWGRGTQVRILLTGIFGLGAALVLLLTSDLGAPRLAMAFDPGEALSSYRPASTIDFRHHRACDR
jgi:hypothetical protein